MQSNSKNGIPYGQLKTSKHDKKMFQNLVAVQRLQCFFHKGMTLILKRAMYTWATLLFSLLKERVQFPVTSISVGVDDGDGDCPAVRIIRACGSACGEMLR